MTACICNDPAILLITSIVLANAAVAIWAWLRPQDFKE